MISRVATVVCAAVSCAGAFAQEVRFNRDVRAVLSDHCFACRGPDQGARKADLRLDTLFGGEFGRTPDGAGQRPS